MLKILYINSNSINKKGVDIKQSLNAVNSLSKFTDIIYYSSWINNRDRINCFSFFMLNRKFKHKRAPIKVITEYFIMEKITRLFFCFFIMIHLLFHRYDLILTRDFSFIYLLSMMPFKPGIKIIFESHKIYHKTSRKVNYNQEKKALSMANLFIANSTGTARGLEELFNIEKNKILVLNNGVNLNDFKKTIADYNYLKEEYNISRDDNIIIYTGSFFEWKGVDYLIEAFKYLKSDKIKLILLGGNIDDINRIKDKSKNFNNIIIKGFKNQEELIKVLNASKIAVIPNKYSEEGENYTSPVKTFEYLAMGLPIIASRLPSLQEILKEKTNCLFFTPENSKDLAKKISILLKDKRLYKNISKNNLIKSKEYSWENRSRKMIDFLKKNILRENS